jgi:hypothetical protein
MRRSFDLCEDLDNGLRFLTTGADDEKGQEDQAQRGDVAGAVFAAVEQRTVGAGVLSARGDQREFIPALAVIIGDFG